MHVGRWVDTVWPSRTMEHCSTMKGNEVLTDATVWMDLENSIFSEKPDSKGHMLWDSSPMKYPEEANPKS